MNQSEAIKLVDKGKAVYSAQLHGTVAKLQRAGTVFVPRQGNKDNAQLIKPWTWTPEANDWVISGVEPGGVAA